MKLAYNEPIFSAQLIMKNKQYLFLFIFLIIISFYLNVVQCRYDEILLDLSNHLNINLIRILFATLFLFQNHQLELILIIFDNTYAFKMLTELYHKFILSNSRLNLS